MTTAERDSVPWGEETVSEVLWQGARPTVLYAPFTKQQEEPVVGADWLWWWVDSAGECFGMLVQAKRFHRSNGSWTVDFKYNNGQQLRALLDAAEQLEVPAAYVVYTGGEEFRRTSKCGPQHTVDCTHCVRRSVSVLTTLQAELASASKRDAANLVMNEALALEDLVVEGDSPVLDLNLQAAPMEVQTFLRQRQGGARGVARTLFRAVCEARSTAFSAASGVLTRTDSEAIFQELPEDRGHFVEPYYPHLLRGLRRGPPDYVADVLQGREPVVPTDLPVAGVVVIRL